MYHTEPPTDKTIREWYMNSSRVAACALRNEQAVRAYGPGRPLALGSFNQGVLTIPPSLVQMYSPERRGSFSVRKRIYKPVTEQGLRGSTVACQLLQENSDLLSILVQKGWRLNG